MAADLRPAKLDIVLISGDDFALAVTAVDGDAVAVDLSAATIVGEILDGDGTVVDTMSSAVSGAGSNVITLSLTDTETAALTGTVTWHLSVTRSGSTRDWLAGRFRVASAGDARGTAATSTAITATVDTDVTVTVGAVGTAGAASVAIADAGSYYTGTDVETALQEIGAGTTLDARYAPSVFDVTWADYGADPTGAADSTTAILAADAACEAAGGGVVYFPAGTYRCDSQLTLADDSGAPVPKSKARRWIGAGSWATGKTINSAPNGGTILDMRNASNPGIFLKSEGLLHVEGITFTNLGTAHTQPMIVVTNTTAHIVGCGFFGHTTKTTTGCDQDAIRLGGTTYTIGTATTGPFQGYGTKIESCHFNRIKRGVWGRSYANAVNVLHNTWWAQCGGSAAIEFDGGDNATDYNVGASIVGNLIECVGYTRAMSFDFTQQFSVVGNDFYDDTAIDASGYMLIGDDCDFNTIIPGHYDNAKPIVSQVGSNTIIDATQSAYSTFSQPVRFSNATPSEFTGAQVKATHLNGFLSQPDADVADTAVSFKAVRSAVAASNPGSTIFQVEQSGLVTVGGDQGGNMTFKNAAGSTVAQFTGAAKNWILSGTGGAMLIDSGSGGSYITFKAYALVLKDQAGANEVRIKSGTGTPEGALAFPVGSIYMRSDGGTGTTFYVKESGTGNTGWVAK